MDRLHLASFAEIDGRASICGECDLSNADEIEAWLISFGPGPLDVDLAGVTFLDSSGLYALMRVTRKNPSLRVVNPSPIVRRVLEVTGTTYLIDDRTSA